MTTKHLTGAYPGGYALGANYTGLVIEPTASVGGTGVSAAALATIVNYGSVNAKTAGSFGVFLQAGGAVVNGSTSDTTALLYGYQNGVRAEGAAATIVNFATISSTYYGVYLKAGGTVTNGSAGDTTANIGSFYGGVFAVGAPASVVNFGTIDGGHVDGVLLRVGGSVTNGSTKDTSAYIGGGYDGVGSQGAATIANFGTIKGVVSNGVSLAGGTLTNGSAADTKAFIEGYQAGVSAGAGSVVNFGTITNSSAGNNGVGVYLGAGAAVTNGSAADTAALIQGYGYGYGVFGYGAGAQIANFATISGQYAVRLKAGGTVTNGSAADTKAILKSPSVGVWATGAAATIVNFATISGDYGTSTGEGVNLAAGGSVTNGSAKDTAALIEGPYDAVTSGASAAIVNFATMYSGFGVSVELKAGGSVTNGSAGDTVALIKGYLGGVSAGGAVSIVNFGTISDIPGSGSNSNGVNLAGGGTVINGSAKDAAALIHGYTYGVNAYAGTVTVTNFGTISGVHGAAVKFTSASDALVVEAGCAFVGAVLGGGGRLTLATGSGSIGNLTGGNLNVFGSMPATVFTNFGTVDIGPAAQFTLLGTGAIGAGGTTVLNIAGTLTVTGSLSVGGGVLAGPGVLALAGGTATFNAGTFLTVAGVAVSGAGALASVATNLTYAKLWTQTAGTLSVAAGDEIKFIGAGNTFAGTLAGAGTVAFLAGGSDTLSGTTLAARVMVNGPTVTLAGAIANTSTLTASNANLIVAAGGASLAGGGRVILTNSGGVLVQGAVGAATLTNIDNRITGAGLLGGGQMTFVNGAAGIVNGDLAALLTLDTGANAIVNNGLIEATNTGGVTVMSKVGGSGSALVSAGTLFFAATFSQNVAFGAAGVLELAQSQAYGGKISGFSKTGATALDLNDIAFGGSTVVSFGGTATSGVLKVTDGVHTANITLIGDYTASTFTLSSDGHGGTLVKDPTAPAPPVPAPAQAFVAAMAGLGGPVGGSAAHLSAQSWRATLPLLVAPRAHFA